MRLLFAHPSLLTEGNHRGAIKSQRALVAALASAGHDCEVVAERPSVMPDTEDWNRLSSLRGDAKASRSIRFTVTSAGPSAPNDAKGARRAAEALRGRVEFYGLVGKRVRGFAPDWVICENGTVGVRVMRALAGRRLALSVATPASLPFGPLSAAPSWSGAARAVYVRTRKIFCVSRFAADYVRRYTGIDAFVQPQLAYGKPPFGVAARFDGAVTVVNPAPHKGGAIFAALATAFPATRFRAVLTYATPISGLRSLPNVDVVSANDDLDRVLADTAVLVVPSLWGEGFGMVCVDAMLRKIPVLASDDGGLPEAMLGAGTCIPVVTGRLRRKWNGELEFESPALDLAPWRDALASLLANRATWEAESARARKAAAAYVEGLSIEPLCRYLST